MGRVSSAIPKSVLETVGDIITASAVSTPSRIAAPAIGQVPISQGVGVQPVWSPTLTGLRVTPRVGTVASSATPTINTDNVDVFVITAQAVDITSMTTNLSGTPTNGQVLLISITGTAARAITWGASFENGLFALPTTTVSTARLDTLLVWNAATSKWRCQLTQGNLDLAAKRLVFTTAYLDESSTIPGRLQVSLTAGGLTGFQAIDLIANGGSVSFETVLRALLSGASFQTADSNGATLFMKARDTGVGLVEVAQLVGAAEPRLAHTRPVNLLGAAAAVLTIATGAITIIAGYNTVDTEAAAASDDLDTINGGRGGDIYVFSPANAARTVVAKHGTGNLNLSGGADFTMDEDDDFLMLLLVGATWQEIGRSENHV